MNEVAGKEAGLCSSGRGLPDDKSFWNVDLDPKPFKFGVAEEVALFDKLAVLFGNGGLEMSDVMAFHAAIPQNDVLAETCYVPREDWSNSRIGRTFA